MFGMNVNQRSRYDVRFRLFGTPVTIQPWFWGICLLMGLMNHMSMVQTFLLVLAVCGSILLHEFGHVFVAKAFGSRDQQVVLHGFGGLAIGAGARRWWQRMAVSAAGPGAGLVLWLGLTLALALTPIAEAISEDGRFFLGALLWINLYWSLLNLLPVQPLDGGHIALEFLRHRDPHRGMEQALYLSVAVGGGAAVYFLATGQFFVAILLGLLAWQSWRLVKSPETRGYR